MFRYINAADRSYLRPCDYFGLGSRSRPSICHNGETCEQDVITPGGAVVRLVDGKTALELARRDRRRRSLATLIASPPFTRRADTAMPKCFSRGCIIAHPPA